MPVSICRRSRRRSREDDAIGDRQPLGVAPVLFPEFLRRAPEGAEAFGALAQFGFVEGDAHCDDVVVAAPGDARAGFPLGGSDDQLDGGVARAGLRIVQVADANEARVAALDQFSRALLSGTQR